MVDIPRAQPLPTGVTEANIGKGLSEGLDSGAKMAYLMQQTRALQQQRELEQKKLQAEIEQRAKTNALTGLERATTLYDSAPKATQPEIYKFIKKQMSVLAPDVQLPDTPAPSGFGKDLGYFIDQNKQWHDTNGKEGLSDADAMYGATKYISSESPKWATLDTSILNATPAAATKEPMAGPPGTPPTTFTPKTGSASPMPGGTPGLTTMPGGTSPTQIDLDLQKQFVTRAEPLHNALAAGYAVNQLAKVKDTSGASDWGLLENAVVAMNPNSILSQNQGGLNAQTAPQLLKTGGIPEQLTAYIQAKAGGQILSDSQRQGIAKAVTSINQIHRTQLNSLIQGFGHTSKSFGGMPERVTTPVMGGLPPDNTANNEGQDNAQGSSLADRYLKALNPAGA